MGAFASRVTVMTGEATRLAAAELREKAIDAAAETAAGARRRALDMVDGEDCAHRRDGGPLDRPWRDRPRARPRLEIGAERCARTVGGRLFHTEPHELSIRCAHRGRPRRSRNRCGHIERYLVAYDVGKAVNPMLIEGQIVGGCAQGIGGALLEEFSIMSAASHCRVTFADYLMPTAREVPPVEVLDTRGRTKPAQSAGLERRRRRRRQCGRRCDRRGNRRCASACPMPSRRLPITPAKLLERMKSRKK